MPRTGVGGRLSIGPVGKPDSGHCCPCPCVEWQWASRSSRRSAGPPSTDVGRVPASCLLELLCPALHHRSRPGFGRISTGGERRAPTDRGAQPSNCRGDARPYLTCPSWTMLNRDGVDSIEPPSRWGAQSPASTWRTRGGAGAAGRWRSYGVPRIRCCTPSCGTAESRPGRRERRGAQC